MCNLKRKIVQENSLAHSRGEERESQSEEQVQVAGFI